MASTSDNPCGCCGRWQSIDCCAVNVRTDLRRRSLLAGLSFSLVAGAASVARAQSAFEPLTDIPQDHGVVYLYRPNRLVGSGVALRVAVDGSYAGSVRNRSYLPLTLTAGIHVFSAAPYESRWLQAPRATPTDVSVTAGQSAYVRVAWSMLGAYSAGEVEFQGVDEAAALGEIARLRRSE